MEPDCVQIKSNWLEALENSVIWPNAPFWIKGSQFTGHPDYLPISSVGYLIHINANAFYNIGSEIFKKFFEDEIEPILPSVYGFDTDIYNIIYDLKNLQKFRHILHLIQHNNVIQNTYYIPENITKFNLDCPYTYMLHTGSLPSKPYEWKSLY